MRAVARGLVAFPLIGGLFACTQAVDDSTEGDEEETEATAQAVAVTDTPGKAVWTKVWRWATYREPTRATDVATDETGAAFLTRAKISENLYAMSADVARYTATGALSYRVTLTGYDLIIPDSLRVAARGGRVVATADRGASGVVSVLDAASGATVRRFTLGAEDITGSTGRVFVRDVAVDDDGGFVIVARAVGTVDWGKGPMPDQNTNTPDAIVARFDAAGALLAARRFEGADARFVSLDGSGYIYVGGKGQLTAPFTQTNYGVSKLSRSLLINDSFFLEGDATMTAMDVSRGGRVTFGGGFYGALRVGPDRTLQESNVGSKYGDAYAVKLDTSMNAASARAFESSARAIVSGIGIDSYGQVVVSLNFIRDLTIGGTVHTAPGDDERLALVKLGATSFEPRWTKVYGATKRDDQLRAGERDHDHRHRSHPHGRRVPHRHRLRARDDRRILRGQRVPRTLASVNPLVAAREAEDRQRAVRPPSITSSAPVTNFDSSLAR